MAYRVTIESRDGDGFIQVVVTPDHTHRPPERTRRRGDEHFRPNQRGQFEQAVREAERRLQAGE